MIRKHDINKVIIRYNNDLNNLSSFNEPIHEIIFSKPYGKYNFDMIPYEVKKLSFNYKYENNPSDIPDFIKDVYFYDYTNLLEDLPTNIETVIINKGFNNVVDNLGNNFKIIDFGSNFNQLVDDLPTSLEKITFGINFTHTINNLNDNIKSLYLHNQVYDYSKISKLPKSLIFFQIGTNADIELKLIPDYNVKQFCFLENSYKINFQYYKNFYFHN